MMQEVLPTAMFCSMCETSGSGGKHIEGFSHLVVEKSTE